MKNRAAVQLALGRKDQEYKAGVRRIVRRHGQEAHGIAYFLSAYKAGRMQRLLKLTFTPGGFGFDLG